MVGTQPSPWYSAALVAAGAAAGVGIWSVTRQLTAKPQQVSRKNAAVDLAAPPSDP